MAGTTEPMYRDLQMSLTLLAAAALGVIGGCVGPDGAGTMEARSLGEEPLAQVDYVSVADSETLNELVDVETNALASLAVRIGGVRLIDNVTLQS